MVLALILATLALTGVVEVWHVLAINLGLGLVNAFDVPARQSFVVEMVEDREDLSNAIALNSSVFNSARLFGPAIAGVLTAAVGEGYCFLINGLSYIAVIWALLAMRLDRERPERAPQRVLEGLWEGLRYVLAVEPIRALLVLIALVSLMSTPYMVLLPVYTEKFLHADARGLGFLMASTGLGALCGALYLASRRSVVGLERLIPVATTVFGVGLVGLSYARVLPLSMALLVVTGTGMMVQMAGGNTVLQTIVDDDKRGRVMSLYALAFMGTAPFGSLLAGWMAEHYGVPFTIRFGGIAAIFGAAAFAARLSRISGWVRPLYVSRGILPAESPDA
jgi:MFS family permease